jgi:ABC-type Fe3+ transport system permease subunit
MITLLTRFAASCDGGSLFGFPRWYKYLDGVRGEHIEGCVPKISGINDVWLVGAAVLEMLLRVAALAAIAFVVWGGIRFITSQGEPNQITQARNTIVSALVGLIISVAATVLVSFVAGRFH